VIGADCVLVATPAQSLRQMLGVARHVAAVPLVLCAKGIERDTGRLMSDIAAEILPESPVAALSGPSFAADVARGLPTAVTVAARECRTPRSWRNFSPRRISAAIRPTT
jgi:glycerol-3-phosphate dehydrogenase (NAD(P)+)